ncbi:MAG: ATP-binding protein [Leptospiraceae bacterium]|nr:ATP-binding protein [Leptospiraceae bacterium]MBK9498635.1 ATP-binding protein [Leptospiraceae bacterium]MBL0266171.1 ATP-binding protein [Leptospiraceae bacterium]
MNKSLLKRLFKTMPPEENLEIVRVAQEIISDERKKGHSILADDLEIILKKRLAYEVSKPKGKVVPLHDIPTDRRYKIPLAKYVDREELRHHMILPPTVEEKIRRIEEEYAGRERLALFGLKPRKKILFYGHPGCGKSMSAERIAWNLGLPFLKVRFEAILSSFLGESAGNLRGLFDSIADYPCVLLLDEFDYIGKKRESNNDVGEMHRIVNILLHLMEEYASPGILIATTNVENSLDNALFRRFDDVIEIPRPSEKEIHQLLKSTLSSIKISNKIDWKIIANKLNGYSAAIVVKIAQDASKEAVLKQELPVNESHILKAIEENKDTGK